MDLNANIVRPEPGLIEIFGPDDLWITMNLAGKIGSLKLPGSATMRLGNGEEIEYVDTITYDRVVKERDEEIARLKREITDLRAENAKSP